MAVMASSEQTTTRFDKFMGRNYSLWKWRMQMVLEEKGLWEIVKGEETAPADEAEEEEVVCYQRREHLAYVFIYLSLGDGPAEEVRHETTAKGVWEALATTYEPRNLANVLRLKREQVNLRMRSSDKVKDHVQRLIAIAAKLSAIGEPVPKRELAFMLLNSLPSSYSHLVVTTDGREEARDLGYIIGRLEQEEQRLGLDRERTPETAMLTREEWKARGRTEGKRGEQGERKPRGGTNQDLEEVVCHYCKGKGHIARGCAKKFADMKRRKFRGQQVAMMVMVEELGKEDNWVIDSAVSTHMFASRVFFCRYEGYQEPSTMYLGDNGTIDATGIGDVEVELLNGLTGVIKGVLHVPKLARNLLSVGAMADMGVCVEFKRNNCVISRNGDVLLNGKKEKGLYKVKLPRVEHKAMMAATREEKTLEKWHRRLGHRSHATIKLMKEKNMVHGLEGAMEGKEECRECALDKMRRLPFKHKRGIIAHRILELLQEGNRLQMGLQNQKRSQWGGGEI
ncbi:hypothetical protein L7F22_033547 [Adiantum nelumboides]|nr:hypothetical protein [Adiantum nelumboides]